MSLIYMDRIGGVMVSKLASSAVDRGFEPWSGQIKDSNIGILNLIQIVAYMKPNNVIFYFSNLEVFIWRRQRNGVKYDNKYYN
jgi:hypothetical protein